MSKISDYIIGKGYIPWFKSQIIRMGILDLISGYGRKDLADFLDSQKDLGGDLLALRRVAQVWENPFEPLDVGESGTIYRFVRFYTWKKNIDRPILTGGTLAKRVKEMEAAPEIINWSLRELLMLEGGTTQWATMAILLGNSESLPEIPFYLRQTYDAIKHWNEHRECGKVWEPQRDPTLIAQVEEYVSFLKTGKINILPNRLGDCDLACFLMAFGVLTPQEAKELWPQIQYHESNRIKEMKKTMPYYLESPPSIGHLLRRILGKKITSNDHRAVQAGAMRIQSLSLKTPADNIKQRFCNSGCVNKTWPKFWDCLADIPNILQLS